MVIRHPVADYGSWRAGSDEVAPLRDRHGCTAERVLRDADDPETVLVLHDFPTLDGARSFAADPGLKAAMQRAGAAGPPRPAATSAGCSVTAVRAADHLLAELARRLRVEAGISTTAMMVLATIDGLGGRSTPAEIGRHAVVSSAAMTSLIDTSERKGE